MAIKRPPKKFIKKEIKNLKHWVGRVLETYSSGTIIELNYWPYSWTKKDKTNHVYYNTLHKDFTCSGKYTAFWHYACVEFWTWEEKQKDGSFKERVHCINLER